MANWVLKGLRTGIRTTAYPREPDESPGVAPGLPLGRLSSFNGEAHALVERCPTGAIAQTIGSVEIDYSRCIHCFRCTRGTEVTASWNPGYEWAAQPDDNKAAIRKLENAFGRSLHIRFVDAGACGACVSEARQINNPYYNMHRLGFFITPTPRTADVLLVAGPVSDAMRLPLRKTFEAMPPPKRVIAIGTCAVSGGVFGPSFAASGGVAQIIPVDVVVPGCPPPPLAILHALLVAVGRKPPARLRSGAGDGPTGRS
jgi:Ni,Fe-hydrogenase III small subunit